MSKTLNFSKKILIVPAAQLLLPLVVSADDTGTDTISTNVPVVNLDTVLQNVRNLFFGVVIVACVFMILWAAFNYVTSGGDEKKTETAKKTITYAVVGLIIAALANTIVSIVAGLATNK